jgi:hypothetical protein
MKNLIIGNILFILIAVAISHFSALVNLNLNLLESWGIIMIGVMTKNFYDEYKK